MLKNSLEVNQQELFEWSQEIWGIVFSLETLAFLLHLKTIAKELFHNWIHICFFQRKSRLEHQERILQTITETHFY